MPRLFTKKGEDVWSTVEWEKRTASVKAADGRIVFEQEVEFPKTWSQQASDIVASKYFASAGDEREHSLKQLIGRVVITTAGWAARSGLFKKGSDLAAFTDELTYILLHQYAAFNSPVWFNLGVQGRQQACSACYILSIEDDMGSIRDHYVKESKLFQDGSGAGTNYSTLRGAGEPLSGGGTSSGPMAFIQGLDAASGAIKSGGKTRRAAKMVVMNADHPDVFDFVGCKAVAERMAKKLIEAGFSGDFSDPASVYASLPFQNANNSVRVTDEFMQAVADDAMWFLEKRRGGTPEGVYARDLWKAICQAAWECGDPGLQFDTTINAQHTCSDTSRINASNPCSEYVHIDDSACNLASLNLLKFKDLSVHGEFGHVVQVMITAMESFVSYADYPTEQIKKNSYTHRPLGLGYANLGALLMSRGIAYDSDAGRTLAADVTQTMHEAAYVQSIRMAQALGPCDAWADNKEGFLKVLERQCGKQVARYASKHGVRNCQVTVLAPTGTIGFMMDCDTTGIEPCLALTSYKKLVGGGSMTIVNQTALQVANELGYSKWKKSEGIEGEMFATWLATLPEEARKVFDCSLPDSAGRFIVPEAHVKMMAAVQPYLSGAISKTVNMPASSTVEDVAAIYELAWKSGVKAIAVYRDGCKGSQPVSAAPAQQKELPVVLSTPDPKLPMTASAKLGRRKLPRTRQSITHKVNLGGQKFYTTVGLYEDGKPAEVFLKASKQGSTMAGLTDSFAVVLSLALQHGTPLVTIVDKLRHMSFEPSGFISGETGGKSTHFSSISDYLGWWLDKMFLNRQKEPIKEEVFAGGGAAVYPEYAEEIKKFLTSSTGTMCYKCGSEMRRSGSCYACPSCGETTGCS